MSASKPPLAGAAPKTCALLAPADFFAAIRPTFAGSLTAAQVDGIQVKLGVFALAASPIAFVAYGLATSFWETAQTMRPVREIGRGKGCAYGAPGCHAGQVAYGRGDVQLTWDRNYERADRELGLRGALIANYDLALDPAVSAQVLVRGMTEGWFTGGKFADYLPAVGRANVQAMTNARRIINGQDRAAQIAAIGMNFQTALVAGRWSESSTA